MYNTILCQDTLHEEAGPGTSGHQAGSGSDTDPSPASKVRHWDTASWYLVTLMLTLHTMSGRCEVEHDRMWENPAQSGHDWARSPVSVRDQAKVTQSLSQHSGHWLLQIFTLNFKFLSKQSLQHESVNYWNGQFVNVFIIFYFFLVFSKSSYKCFHLVVGKLCQLWQ